MRVRRSLASESGGTSAQHARGSIARKPGSSKLFSVRIIAGEHRGRRLESPPGRGTRPMLDRVREALFATIGERVDGARVLDLFSGTGSLALEALSRGAAFARAIEADPKVAALLARNAEALEMGERIEVVRGDALERAKWGDEGERFELAFLDPPYPWLSDRRRGRVLEAVRALLEGPVAGGIVTLHAPRRALVGADFAGASATERTYGTTSVWYVEANS